MITTTVHSRGAAPESHPRPSASVIGIYRQRCEPVEAFLDVLGLTHIRIPSDFSPHHVRRETSVIVLPVISAAALWQSESFRLSLDLFVQKLGGTLICLTQNQGDCLRVLPVPRGEPEIAGLGFREMHSAYYHATENIADHPVLAGISAVYSDLNFDGYFTRFPANSDVLITERNNGYPVLLTYPCGNGRVIITTLTLGIGMGYGSDDEFRLAANIFSYSLDGDFMPECILDPSGTGDVISERVQIVNTTNRFGSYAEITLLSPDRTPLDSYQHNLGREMLQPGEIDHLNLTASIEANPGIYWFDVRVFESPEQEIAPLHRDYRIHVSAPSIHENPHHLSIVKSDHRSQACVIPCSGNNDSDIYSGIKVTDSPDSVTGIPGEILEIPFELTNDSNTTRTLDFDVTSGDLFSWSRTVVLEPGQSDLILFEERMPDDLSPHGISVIRYFLNKRQCGALRLNVAKYPVDLEVSMEASAYYPGDTAYVRFEFTDQSATGVKPNRLNVFVNCGKWQKWQNVVLEGKQTEIKVPVPVDVTVDTIQYAICKESGRALAKGELPVQRIYSDYDIQMDKTHYEPGDIMTLSIRTETPGILHIVTPWSSEDFHADTHVKNFETQIPVFVYEGKHHLRYSMENEWRSIPFFVINRGLKVVADALCLPNDGVFMSGDSLTMASDIVSPKDETIEAVVRIGLPSGASGPEIARRSFFVKGNIINHLELSASLLSEEAGPHDIFTDFYLNNQIETGSRHVLDVGPGKIVSIDPILPDTSDRPQRFTTEVYLFGHGEGTFTMDFDQGRIVSETISLNGLKRLVYTISMPDSRKREHRIACRLAFPGSVSQRMEYVTFTDTQYRYPRSDEKDSLQSRGSEHSVLVSAEEYNRESTLSADELPPFGQYNEYEDLNIPSMDYRGLVLLLIGLGLFITRVNE